MADSAASAPRRRAGAILVALLLAAISVYFAFRGGGYFAGGPAAVALVLLVVLAGRVMLARRPAAAFGRPLGVAVVALALFALWTFVSGGWSGAPGRALIELDRVLVYLLALVLFASLADGPARVRWLVRGVALAAVVVCVSALATRLLPGIWAIDYASISTRLSYPVTYWNALGLMAAIGIVLCIGMTSDVREPGAARVLGAAAIPVLGTTLLLTLSRGGILVAVVGLVAFAFAGHSRALLCGLLASAPATAIAVTFAYRSELLVSGDVGNAARDQGAKLAIVVALCAIVAALLRWRLLRTDAALAGKALRPQARRRILAGATAAIVVALVAGAVAVDVSRQYDRFVAAELPAQQQPDARARLANPTNNGRIGLGRVALRQFARTPVQGSGAGTFELVWARDRPDDGIVRDGHSLYLEVLSELGLVGLALVAAAILAILVGLAQRVSGPDRVLFAGVLAAALAWAVAAGLDWHWEMPVVTFWLFALAGAALARADDGDRSAHAPALRWRVAAAGACCVVAIAVPARVALSQERLQASIAAFLAGECGPATTAARESLGAVDGRPQPFEIRAYCALIEGKQKTAVERMLAAVDRDPDNWTLHYALARVQALTGEDPRGAARRAARLNPREGLTRDAVARFADLQRPADWRRAARGMEILVPEV